MRRLDGIIDSMDMSLVSQTIQEILKDREAWHAAGPWGCKESYMTE